MHKLTEGSLEKIMKGIDVKEPIILQMLGYKELPKLFNKDGTVTDRYRLLISDGQRFSSFTMLATQLNNLIEDDVLTEYAICKVSNYYMSSVSNGDKEKRVMLLTGIEVIVPGDKVGHRIGDPVNVENKLDSDSTTSDSTSNNYGSFDISTTPVAALSPYQNSWVIKVRVANKSPIKTWSNFRGEDKLFFMDLIDESGGIRCIAFRDMCDKFYDMIETGNVYYISRCVLKAANKQFYLFKHDYEMIMTNDTEIVPCHENSEDILTLQFNFCSINDVENKEKNE